MDADAAVARGGDALARRSWAEARDAFTEALAAGDRTDAESTGIFPFVTRS
jgi:hypothetical protein